MENHQSALDSAFHALADPTRRAILARLTQGPAPVSALAEPFAIGLPSFLKHLRILEADGLIRSEKRGRVRTCRIAGDRLALAERWLATQRTHWLEQADRLAEFAETQAGSTHRDQ